MANKKFFIPQIEDEEELEEELDEVTLEEENPPKEKYVPEGFVSSIYGKHVKDNAYFHGVKYGNMGRQYDTFRDKDKRVEADDFKEYIIQKEPEEDYNNNNSNYNNSYNNNINNNMNNNGYNNNSYNNTYNNNGYENNNVNNMNDFNNNQFENNQSNEVYYNVPNVNENNGMNNYNNSYNNNMNNGYNNNMNNMNNNNNPYYNNNVNNGMNNYNSNPYQNNNNNQFNNQDFNNQTFNPGFGNNAYNNNNVNNMNNGFNGNNQNMNNYNQNYNNSMNNQMYENGYNNSVSEEVRKEYQPREDMNNFNNNRNTNSTLAGNHIMESAKAKAKKKTRYVAPPLNILKIKPEDQKEDVSGVLEQRGIIDTTLKQFGIPGHVVKYTKGPTVTQFEVQLDGGIRFNKISAIQPNIQANLRATSIRMEIPIPGKATIGIEVPNIKRDTVYFGDMISNKDFLNDGNPMNVVLGINIGGEPVYLDLSKMPHGLIAGSTGSGKSVCINAIIASILYKAHPDDVKLVLVDPKRVEFARYAGIPHLATPIITEPKMANAALKWAVDEMEDRYRLFEATGVTQYKEYLANERTDARLKHIPYLVIIIDELADLMTTAGAEVEESILRLTQKARAAGIHLIVATQRPSVDVINGTIKTNIPTKIAFKVNKALDSNIILDHSGAEKLLGLGDMLYTDEMGVENRIQGAFISSNEIKDVVTSLENYQSGEYLFTEEDLKKKTVVDHSDDALNDELFEEIARYVVDNNAASINQLQKKFSCGFSRIQAIIIKLGELGVVSENLGSRAREVLVNAQELEDILNRL